MNPLEMKSDSRQWSYQPLSFEDIEKIHETTMRVFEEVGFEVHEPEAFEMFKRTGAIIDSQNRKVRLKESTITDLIASAPSKVTLYARAPGQNIELGTQNVYFGTGGTALNILDYHTQKRYPATMSDLIDIIRIVDQLDNVHLMLLPTYPNELPIESVDCNRFFAGLMYTTKHIMGGVYTTQGIHDVIEMAKTIAGSSEALKQHPFISMITCGISPLRLDSKYGAFMIQIAKEGIPLAVPAEPLCGATSPITLAGNLVIQNTDALINVILTQLFNPETPVIYGCVATSTDLRDLNYLGGPVESGLLNAATAQLAQYYKLPYYATAGISDSKTLDAQCGYESAINNLLVALSGADFIHDAAGLMEFALTVSKEKLVIDNEIIGMALRAVEGIEVNDDTLAFDVIRQVGPGGNFIAARHTRKYMHKEHYIPQLSNREKRENWEEQGGKITAELAHEVVAHILSEPVHHCLPDSVATKLIETFPIIEPKYHHEAKKQ
ncbi:MAG: trimethylamine methyltransferase family protein [Thermodesulfobacteriota bacterium]|nr:trimethylamine methyltransferase family protein [Thermodesulfobacteriota bacterium]